MNTAKYYTINGYWKDDKSDTFEGCLVTTHNDEVDQELDDAIFFYFSNLGELQEALEMGEKTCHDFVVTDYSQA